jgi:hypothetical protein
VLTDTVLELSVQRQRELREEVERESLARLAQTPERGAPRGDVRLALARRLHALAARLEAQPVMLEVLD